MLKKKMAAGVVALAMFSTLGLAACNPGGSSSDSSSGGSTAAGSIPEPDVACDIPAGNLDDSKIDTSKVEGEITFQTQGLQNDFGDFFKAKIKEFEDANPGVKINWTDQGGGAEFDQTVTAQASNCKMADVINVPSSTILALSKSNLLMDYDVKAPGIGDKFVKSIWDSTALGANDHHTALPWYFGPYITTYNKEVFKRAGLDENMPPKTMDELFEDAAKVGADGQGDYGIYGSPEWYMIAQLHGMGVNLLNADKTAFDFADNEAAINYVTKLSELYADIVARYGELVMVEGAYGFTSERRAELEERIFGAHDLPAFAHDVERISWQDGCKAYFACGGWVTIRFSGTEPLLRVFAEMPTGDEARATAAAVASHYGLDA